MNKLSGIYKVTNKINNKIYIGKSKDLYTRLRAHHTEPFNSNADMYNSLFYRAIRKYGIDNFQFEIIEYCSEDDLNEREKYWIKYYNSYINTPNGYGYNMTEGGETNCFYQQYDRELILSLWNQGKTHKEIREIVNCPYQTLTRILDELQIDIIERRRRGKYNAREVLQYTLKGEFIQEFSSLSEAARYIKSSSGNISKACQGILKSVKGFQWRYKDRTTNIDDISSYKKINNSQSNIIYQYDLNGNLLHIYNNVQEAAKENNIQSPGNINRVCSGARKTAGGYIWKYAKDIEHREVLNND